MEEPTPLTGTTDSLGRSSAQGMDVGLLRRGDGKLLVVPLGTSVGGFAELQEFFRAMPMQSGDTIEQSEAFTEELQTSNEELKAMNEKLRSATEELETSREELKSINEELRTVNDVLKSTVDQLAKSNNDLQNLMAANDIATIFLDCELRVQRFTPSAKTLFSFI